MQDFDLSLFPKRSQVKNVPEQVESPEQLWVFSEHSLTSTQIRPSLRNPALQSHANDPFVFLQTEFSPQTLVSAKLIRKIRKTLKFSLDYIWITFEFILRVKRISRIFANRFFWRIFEPFFRFEYSVKAVNLLRAVWVQGDQRPPHVRMSQCHGGSFVEPGAHASARMTHDVHCRAWPAACQR